MQTDEPKQPEHRRRESFVPTVAVSAVAAMAVLAAVMAKRADTSSPQQAILEPARPVESAEVVKAPPLARAPTQSMGGAAACRECGIVHMVVAVYDQGKPQPRGYQMHIRMDDGSVRTIEQRGALAAGSRVIVEGTTVKPMS